MKRHSHDALMKLCRDSEESLRSLHSEQRSNVLLVSGDHYSKKRAAIWGRIRDREDLTSEQKIRITKNHTQTIIKTYERGVLALAPWAKPAPSNEDEIQDKKSAELCSSVWEDAKHRYDLKSDVRNWVEDFFRVGEVAVRIVWDPTKGFFKGYKQAVDEEGSLVYKRDPEGNMVLDQMGQPIPEPSEEAVMSGGFEFKRIFGFNLLTPEGAQNMKTAPWLGEKDMVSIEKVKSWVSDDPDKLALVQDDIGVGQDSNIYTFDMNNFRYGPKEGYTMVYSLFFRPCKQYPKGYYYIYTKACMLFEGELPFGIFPIVYEGADGIQSTCRHRSPIKTIRPFQVEINRCASKIAEHHITLGDDKVYIQNGTQMSEGERWPGLRVFRVAGREPVVQQGRTGDQYLPHMKELIEELYRVMNVPMMNEDIASSKSKDGAFGALFLSMKQKAKYSSYGSKFENFLIDLCQTFLSLAKEYYDDDMVIRSVGKNEAVNIAEFKNTDPLSYTVKVVPVSDDLETQFGKQLTMNHALQYVGSNLPPEEIGRFLRNMPFANVEDNFKSLTQNHDSAENLILAIERGEAVEPSPYDDHIFMIKALVARMREPSFRLLDPQIQQTFQHFVRIFQQLEEEQARKLIARNSELIPVDSHMVKIDMYVPKKNSKVPGAMERASLPQSSIRWVMDRLEAQYASQDLIEQLPAKAQTDISLAPQGGPSPQGGPPQGMPPQGGDPLAAAFAQGGLSAANPQANPTGLNIMETPPILP